MEAKVDSSFVPVQGHDTQKVGRGLGLLLPNSIFGFEIN